MKRNIMIIALLTFNCVLGCANESSVDLPPVAIPEKPTIQKLKPIVDELLKSHENIMIRRGISNVFDLIDLYLDADKDDKAMQYITIALQHNSWALPYQMKCAEIMYERGETNAAAQKAAFVKKYTEKDELFERAGKILKENLLPTIPSIKPDKSNKTRLVLIPIGDVDQCVLNDLKQEFSNVLPISVSLRDANVPIPAYKRDPVAIEVSNLRSNLLSGIKQDPRAAQFLKSKGLAEASFVNDEAVIKAYRYFSFEYGGTNSLRQFDTGMSMLGKRAKQCDADDVYEVLMKALRQYSNDKTYFIGIGKMDMFAGKSNFIFGSAKTNGRYAIVSYHRFRAEFNNDNPNRNKLVERTFKQALSSFGFMLGVARCSSPTCARAYPHHLGEHDAKTKKLCPACLKGFENKLGKLLQNTD